MQMAANLLVRRCAARLPCLVRCQVANFSLIVEPRPNFLAVSPPPFFSSSILAATQARQNAFDPDRGELHPYFKKYNLLKGSHSIVEILDNDKEWQRIFLPCQRFLAMEYFWWYWEMLGSFGLGMLQIMFKEHLMKHCSPKKVQLDEAWTFKEAFSLPSIKLLSGIAEDYRLHPLMLPYEELPQGYKDTTFSATEKKEKLMNFYRGRITDEVMREIEEDIMKKIDQEIMAKRDLDGNSTSM